MSQTIFFFLGVGAALVLLVAVTLPTNLFRRWGAMLTALAAVAIALSLNLYAFGEDRYTSNGMSHWETHNSTGTHALYVVALSAVVLLAVTAAFLRQRPQPLRLVTGCAVITVPLLWFVAVIALVSS